MATCNYHQVFDYDERVWQSWTTTSASTTPSASDYYYYDNEVWRSWTSGASASITVSHDYVDTSGAWYHWNRDYINSGTTVTVIHDSVVWETWISDEQVVLAENPNVIIQDTLNKVFKFKTKSSEEIRAEKAQTRINNEWRMILAQEREEETRQAEVTAQELLLELIGEEEMARYKETGRLFVKGEKYDYVLRKGGGVHRIEKDKVIDFAKAKKAKANYICVHPKQAYNYPESDNVIALKLWIENAEEEFLKIGNLHRNQSEVYEFDKIVGL